MIKIDPNERPINMANVMKISFVTQIDIAIEQQNFDLNTLESEIKLFYETYKSLNPWHTRQYSITSHQNSLVKLKPSEEDDCEEGGCEDLDDGYGDA
jgi:hypothetical protein